MKALLLIFIPFIYSFLIFTIKTFADISIVNYYFSLINLKIVRLEFFSISLNFSISLLSTFFGMLISYFFYFYRLKLKKLFYALIFFPLFLSPHFYVYSFLTLTNFGATFLTSFYKNIPLYIFLSSFHYFPLSFFIFLFFLKCMKSQVFDSISLYKRKIKKRKIFSIFSKMIIKPFLFSLTLIFLLSFNDYITPSFFQIPTIQSEIFFRISSLYDLNAAIILSMFHLFILSPILIVGKFFTPTLTSSTKIFQSRRSSSLIDILILLFLLFINLPIFALLLDFKYYSFLNYISKNFSIIFSTALVYLVLSILFTLLSTILAIENIRNLFSASLLFAFFPSVIIASLILFTFPSNFLSFSYSFLFFVFPRLAILTSFFFTFLPTSFLDSLRIHVKKRAKKISLYFLTLGELILIEIVISFSLLLWELNIPQLLSPITFQPVSLKIENLLHYGNYKEANTLLLVMIALQIFMIYSIIKVGRWLFT